MWVILCSAGLAQRYLLYILFLNLFLDVAYGNVLYLSKFTFYAIVNWNVIYRKDTKLTLLRVYVSLRKQSFITLASYVYRAHLLYNLLQLIIYPLYMYIFTIVLFCANKIYNTNNNKYHLWYFQPVIHFQHHVVSAALHRTRPAPRHACYVWMVTHSLIMGSNVYVCISIQSMSSGRHSGNMSTSHLQGFQFSPRMG